MNFLLAILRQEKSEKSDISLVEPYLVTECPKIYRKYVLQVYRQSILKQMQCRFAVNFGTLSTYQAFQSKAFN